MPRKSSGMQGSRNAGNARNTGNNTVAGLPTNAQWNRIQTTAQKLNQQIAAIGGTTGGQVRGSQSGRRGTQQTGVQQT
jgi:hypothetical protein